MNSLNIEQILKYVIRPVCHGASPYAILPKSCIWLTKFGLVQIIIHMNNHDSTKTEQS